MPTRNMKAWAMRKLWTVLKWAFGIAAGLVLLIAYWDDSSPRRLWEMFGFLCAVGLALGAIFAVVAAPILDKLGRIETKLDQLRRRLEP